GVGPRVHRDPGALVKATAPEVAGVDEGGAGGIELRHEGVAGAAEGRLKTVLRRREVGGEGPTRHVGVTCSVHGDPGALVTATTPGEGGIDEVGAGGIKLRHE